MERRVHQRVLFLQRKKQTSKISDNSARILLVEPTIDDTVFVLINIYNANTKLEQLETLQDIVSFLGKVKGIQDKNIVLRGDFYVIFDISLESLGGNPSFKKKSLAKLVEIKENLIYETQVRRIRNTKIKRLLFDNNIYQDLFKED